MFENMTCPTLDYHNTSHPTTLNDSNTVGRDSISVASHVAILLLAPVAVMGNALVLTAIWKKSFQRTPFHILLSVLAFTDLCAGVTGLFFSIRFLLDLNRFIMLYFGIPCAIYLSTFTLLVITLMSIERWLLMTRRATITARRGGIVVAASLLVPIPFVYFNALEPTSGTIAKEVITAMAVCMLLCYLATSFAYIKVFRIIRLHKQQIHGNQSRQNPGQTSINLAKYKRSVISILYILALFSVSFLPIIFSSFVLASVGVNGETLKAQLVCFVFMFLSSSVNPGLYIWRMTDVRYGVIGLFRTNI